MTNGTVYCNRCGTQNSALARFCANCGTPFSAELRQAVPQPETPGGSPRLATVGKMVFGLKVTNLEGHRISFARATGRHFAKLISAMILLIGYIMAGFSERKQALHDMIAGTLVVRTQ